MRFVRPAHGSRLRPEPCTVGTPLQGHPLSRCSSWAVSVTCRKTHHALTVSAAQEDAPPERRPHTPVLQEQPSPSRRAHQGQLAREAADAQQHMHTRSAEAAGSAQKRAALAASRRRVAADWVEELTGVALPTASDHAFRAALRDGVLLCRVLNTLRPGYISRVSGLLRSLLQCAVSDLLPSCSIQARSIICHHPGKLRDLHLQSWGADTYCPCTAMHLHSAPAHS